MFTFERKKKKKKKKKKKQKRKQERRRRTRENRQQLTLRKRIAWKKLPCSALPTKLFFFLCSLRERTGSYSGSIFSRTFFSFRSLRMQVVPEFVSPGTLVSWGAPSASRSIHFVLDRVCRTAWEKPCQLRPGISHPRMIMSKLHHLLLRPR